MVDFVFLLPDQKRSTCNGETKAEKNVYNWSATYKYLLGIGVI